MFFNVMFGNGQCVRGDIDSVDFGFREGIGAGDGNTGATGTHIENMLRFVIYQPGELVIDQFANRRARYQHALINIEFMAAEPCFVGQVSDGNAFVDAANHALDDTMFFAGGQARGAHIFRYI